MGTKKETCIRIVKIMHLFISVLIFASSWLYYKKTYDIYIAGRYDVFVYAMFGVLMYFFVRTYNAYMIEYQSFHDCVFCLCLSSAISTAGVYVLTLIAWNKFHAPWIFLVQILEQWVFGALWTLCAMKLYSLIVKPLPAIVIYRNEADLERLSEIRKHENKYNVVKYLEDPLSLEETVNAITECGAKAVFLAGVNATLRNGIAKYCIEKDLRGFFIPHIGDVILSGGDHIQAFSVPIMSIRRNGGTPEYLLIKRMADIIISAIAIVITSPLMAVTALAVRLYDGGPAFYRQVRLTKGRKEFKILKFRSMRVDAEKDGIARLSTGENDDRVTPVGRIIRAVRLDELPQLINIFTGDMSIVGPRPERPELAEIYEQKIPAFSLRLQAKAGLTGYAQVYGKYNTDPYDKLEMDLMYINKMNLLLDIQIMFATVRILFKKESTEGVEEGKTNSL